MELISVAGLAYALVLRTRIDDLAFDFRNEFYPQASIVRDGENPYQSHDAHLPSSANNTSPIAAAPVVAMLTRFWMPPITSPCLRGIRSVRHRQHDRGDSARRSPTPADQVL